jgi:hypothetical protein
MGFPSDDADHFVTYTTPRGSTVTLPNLTETQRDAAVAALDPGPVLTEAAGKPAEKQTCGRCGGAGGWHETVTTKTGSGGTVTTQKWVNCRPCGGSGQVPK